MKIQILVLITLLANSALGHAGVMITPTISAEPIFGFPGGVLQESGLANATDGDINTGYVASALPGSVNQAQGLHVRFDFDLSGFSAISGFNFTFNGILDTQIQSGIADGLYFGSAPFTSNRTLVGAPLGVAISTSLNLTPGAAIGFQDLNNYLSNDVLSVFAQTRFGTTNAAFDAVSITTLEVSGEVLNDSQLSGAVPVPTTLALLSLGLLGLSCKRRKNKHSQHVL